MIKGLIVVAALALAILVIGMVIVARAQQLSPRVGDAYLPPLEYDRPYTGRLIIHLADTLRELQEICNKPTIACARSGDGWCHIFKVSDQTIRLLGWNPIHVMRHEHAHCWGWTKDHKGTRVPTPQDDARWNRMYDFRDLYREFPKEITTLKTVIIPELRTPPP